MAAHIHKPKLGRRIRVAQAPRLRSERVGQAHREPAGARQAAVAVALAKPSRRNRARPSARLAAGARAGLSPSGAGVRRCQRRRPAQSAASGGGWGFRSPRPLRQPCARDARGRRSQTRRDARARMARQARTGHGARRGFAWNGKTYGSLSQVAKAITGTSWNGHRFFGLRSGAPAAGKETLSRAPESGSARSSAPRSEAAP